MEKIVVNIKQIMQFKGLRQEDLVKAWGYKQPNVSAILNGKRDIKYHEVQLFADLAGMSIVDVIRFPDGTSAVCPKCQEHLRTIKRLNDIIDSQEAQIKRLQGNKNGTDIEID